ncbi:hypothetical protein ACR9GP_09275 [Enterobacter ludwigii]|uniref:hypothetical protein n=1 Tax=Enterobacter TaxID=547 RepID=UPI0021C58EF4|nr:hypothetical protein [Enterobacter ludwigii]MCU2394337.1 hypothetical protein [Enterobacter ludwigii]
MKHATPILLSAGIMLASMSAVNAATPDALIQAHHQRCGKPVFYAQTASHKKEVEICIITPSVSYSFGKTGEIHKEMNISVPATATSYAYQSNQVISLQEFTVRNGDISYLVSAGTNDEGKPFASLDVYQGTPDAGKHLAEIRLDPDTVVNNISHALAQEGVAQSDSL